MLTDVVMVNGSLRPAVFPWAPQANASQAPKPADPLPPEQELFADKVIERVQAKLALILPEMMRTAVDEVLNEHLREVSHSQSSERQT